MAKILSNQFIQECFSEGDFDYIVTKGVTMFDKCDSLDCNFMSYAPDVKSGYIREKPVFELDIYKATIKWKITDKKEHNPG